MITISGGSYNYLGDNARWGELIVIPHDLEKMAERLAGLPYAVKAAADTAAVIETLKSAQAQAKRLADVWHAVEWWDSGDWGEDRTQEAIGVYVNPPAEVDSYEVPDRGHLIGKPVTVKLHSWARPGPVEGIFAGQGDHGFSLRTVGGGRWVWWHTEVAAVAPVIDAE